MSSVQWVIKATKFCNLRCRYCYEYPWLADSTRIGPDALAAFFQHIAAFYAARRVKMDFVWHGGEPLLLGADYYRQIFELQEAILKPQGVEYENSIQTNLVRLPTEALDLLRQFTNIGVSIDVFGDLRVNAAGKAVHEKILQNMQLLLDQDIRFGCITVLSKATAPHIAEIFQFFSDLGLSFRLLPIYRTGYPNQHDEFGLSPAEVVTALKQAIDCWLELTLPIQVRPIEDYVAAVLRRYMNHIHQLGHYSKKRDESLFIVNTDGGLFSNADAYAAPYCYGNIFQTPLDRLLKSEGYKSSKGERLQRMRAVCEGCRYFGACSGFYIGEATPEQRYVGHDGRLVCGVVEPLLDYVETKLAAHDLIDSAARRLSPNLKPHDFERYTASVEF